MNLIFFKSVNLFFVLVQIISKKFIDITECKLILTELNGFIKSPGFPRYTPYYATCQWLIKLPVGFLINIDFINFG